MKHEENVEIVKFFMYEHRKHAWPVKEVVEKTGLALKTVKGILRSLHKKGVLNKRHAMAHRVVQDKEHMFPINYYWWNLGKTKSGKGANGRSTSHPITA